MIDPCATLLSRQNISRLTNALRRTFAACLLSLAVAPLAVASQLVETDDFADVVRHVERVEAEFGAESVLLVIDIDNTLLAMNHPLGSDQWFEWQTYLQDHEPASPQLVAKDFPRLLHIQGMLFTLGKMRPPQANLPALVAGVQSRGIKTLVLTSRGPDFRVATQRELNRNGYDFTKSTLPVDAPGGYFLPYKLDAIAESGLTAEEAKVFDLGKPRMVSFANGVFMTAGQHKGAMLLVMMAKCDTPIKAVVFADDHGRHVTRVYDALSRRGIDVTTVHYKREDANVDRFNYGSKEDVTKRWQRLDKTLRHVFE